MHCLGNPCPRVHHESVTRISTRPAPGIGALARVAGVAPETIRSWERRYGFPAGTRLPSGHRRYPPALLERARLIRHALALGIPAGEAVPAEPEALRRLVEASEPARPPPPQAWLQAAAGLDSEALEAGFDASLRELGTGRFVRQAVLPFLAALGEGWRRGRISVAVEHLASERLAGFLSARWRTFTGRSTGDPVLLATLPGEAHVLGLHLGALLLADLGIPVVMLGAGCPVRDLLLAAGRRRFRAILVSISRAAPKARTRAGLLELADGIAQLPLLVGAPWAPPRHPSLRWLPDFATLETWVVETTHGSGRNAS